MPERGLFSKYSVAKNGHPVEDCFVLEPETDPAARAALEAYAQATQNDALAADLHDWLQKLNPPTTDP